MDISTYSRKDIGNLGEKVACEYLRRSGFTITGRNIASKMGELDIVAQKELSLHIVEVKTVTCIEFPSKGSANAYNPADNLHANKIRKVVRTAEWFVARSRWEGEWQVDGALVWLRLRDGMTRIQYYSQIV